MTDTTHDLATHDPEARAREIGPSLAQRADRIEAARTLPDDVVQDLLAADMFRTFIPAAYGGAETDILTGMAALTELGRWDGSTAWCVMIANTTALLAGYLPPEHAETIYCDPRVITGGYTVPTGTARVVDGGLLVSGTWAWGSGTRHCTWIGGTVRLVDDDGNPTRRDDGLSTPYVFFEPDDIDFVDTWHVMGLAGTGSTDFTTTDTFVPEGRWVQVAGATPVVDGPLWRFPFFGMLAAGVASVAIGIAAGAVERFAELAPDKIPQGSSRPLAERAPAQADLSRAEATVRSSRAYLDQALGEAWKVATRGDPLTVEHRRLIRQAAADAAQRCADSLVRLHRQAGGIGVYLSEPLQRAVRDSQVAATHGMVAERIHELTGRFLLGLDTDTSLL